MPTSAQPPQPPLCPFQQHMLPLGILMDINARHAKQPSLTYCHCGGISYFGQDCPTGFNICFLSQDNHEDLLESLLALKDKHCADASTRGMDQRWIGGGGFCMQQQVNSMPLLPSHNCYTVCPYMKCQNHPQMNQIV